MNDSSPCDVLVIGAGPAGTAAATVLAQHGRSVRIVEKSTFPRYSIGESLIPYCWFTLERLGMLDAMEAAGFQKKHSVQFVNPDGRVSQPFFFEQHFDHPASTTWQVLRADFDRLLLDNARAKGVDVVEGTRVTDFIREDGRVVGVHTANGASGEFRAPLTIDCSGRGSPAVARNRWRVSDDRLKRIAIWTYYRGAVRDPGRDEGATTVAFLPEGGWFWYIPLANDLVSVGAVATSDYLFSETRDLATVFDREVARNKWIEAHLAPGTRCGAPGFDDGPLYVTSEWSYRAKQCAEDGLVLAGDALGFLDPVFSSGVLLALVGGEKVGDAAHAALEADDVSAARFADYGAEMARGVASMRSLVYAFYDPAFRMRDFIRAYPHLQGDITECLIGNVFRDFTDLFSSIDAFAGRTNAAS